MPLSLRDNVYWATRAMEVTAAVNRGGIPNNLTGPERTGGRSVLLFEKLDEDYKEEIEALYEQLLNGDPDQYSTRMIRSIAIRARLLAKFRGGGTCHYLSAYAFYWLAINSLEYTLQENDENSISRLAYNDIEYVDQDMNGGHHFIVIGRDKSSNIDEPLKWGDKAIICDPWAGTVFTPEYFYYDFATPEIIEGEKYQLIRTQAALKHYFRSSESDLAFLSPPGSEIQINHGQELNQFLGEQKVVTSFFKSEQDHAVRQRSEATEKSAALIL